MDTDNPNQTNQSATGQANPQADFIQDEIAGLQKKVDDANLPSELRDQANRLISRLKRMTLSGNYSREFEPVAQYINWITQLPFGKYTKDNLDLSQAKQVLETTHYGLAEVKNRVLQYLAILNLQSQEASNIDKSSTGFKKPEEQKVVEKDKKSDQEDESISEKMKKLTGNSANAPVLCFVGIQGVGKTSIAKSIATALGREFVRISLGAMGSSAELRGRSRGEIDAEPGQVIKALIRTQTMNPLILLDELDKVSGEAGLLADVMAALLEILDPEQNATFMDKYIDYPIDLSKCIFICTANNLGGISAALIDRLEMIRFGSYTDSDKIMIAKNYLLPKVRKATGIGPKQLEFADDVWPLVVRPLGFDAGVRQLERTLTELARKVALRIVQGTGGNVLVTKDNFREFIPEKLGVYS